MVRYLGDTAGRLTGGRKDLLDFQRESAEFDARKKQREMQAQLMPLEMEKAQLGLEKMKQDMAAPKLPFQGTAFDAQVANEAYKFNLSKGLDDAQARQKAIDMVYGSKVDYKMMPDPNNPYAPPQMRAAPRNPIFGESESFRTPGIMPEVGASQIPQRAQMNVQSTSQPPMIPQMGAADVGGMQAPQIDPRAMTSPDVQKKAAEQLMKMPGELQQKADEANIAAAQSGASTLMTERAKQQATNEKRLQAIQQIKGDAEAIKKEIKKLPSGGLENMVGRGVNFFGYPVESQQAKSAINAPLGSLVMGVKQLVRDAGEGVFTEADQKFVESFVFNPDDQLENKISSYNAFMDYVDRAEQALSNQPLGAQISGGAPGFRYMGVVQ